MPPLPVISNLVLGQELGYQYSLLGLQELGGAFRNLCCLKFCTNIESNGYFNSLHSSISLASFKYFLLFFVYKF